MSSELLPWLAAPLEAALQRRGHALLVSGPAGVGQLELSLALANAWLCEAIPSSAAATPRQRACGACPGCRLLAAQTHPDLRLLLPDALRESLGWTAADDGEGGDRSSKARPSREIKVDAVRGGVAFAQSTSARGRGKVVLVFPAEQMNGIAANALLKTLEEPPGAARFVLGTAAPDVLLPTIRSRCQAVPLALPEPALAAPWLAGQGVASPEVLLAGTGGQVQQALEWQALGMGAAQWLALPRQLASGQPGALAGWPPPQVIAVLQKVCHDGMCRAAGATPRYFPAAAFERLPARRNAAGLARFSEWSRELNRLREHADHPYSAALMMDALVARARQVLTEIDAAPPGQAAQRPPLHSPA